MSRLPINSRKARLAIQNPIPKLVSSTPSSALCKKHVPTDIAEKSKVSHKNTDPYFPFVFFDKVRRPKSKVKI